MVGGGSKSAADGRAVQNSAAHVDDWWMCRICHARGSLSSTTMMDRRDFLKAGLGSLTAGAVAGSLGTAQSAVGPQDDNHHRVQGVPIPRYTPRPASMPAVADLLTENLNGIWQFNPVPPADWWTKVSDAGFRPIEVPGEWVMQGFTVPHGAAAGYQREFSVPARWKNQRVKLRCDGIYSDARVWINGREAGHHLGGFTPFELDITELLTFGASERIAVAVRGPSLADELAKGSSYAQHDLGGIARKIYLFAVPVVNVSDVHIVSTLDAQANDAEITIEVELANDGDAPSVPMRVVWEVLAPDGGKLAVPTETILFGSLPAHQTRRNAARVKLVSPIKWDNENPHLHTLKCALLLRGRLVQTVALRFGIRQIEIRDGQVFVNKQPIRLRGACRHETDPLRGRSLAEPMWRRDVELFRAANCNMIRTSHYPPAEEFIEACDELGMFVEEEAPFVWVKKDGDSAEARAYMIQAGMEMVMRDRNHPCIIHWSLGNESDWSESFHKEGLAIRALDSTRPLVFDGGMPQPSFLNIMTPHYPGFKLECPPLTAAPVSLSGVPREFVPRYTEKRPLFFGEYYHLDCYDRREIVTDPGLRDFWVLGLTVAWNLLRTTKGVEGGTLWAGINDLFFLPPRGIPSGYGDWGIIDGWRRPKPEYWNVKKVYSPIRMTRAGAPDSMSFTVDNRNNFTDLSEFRFKWSLGEQSGIARTHGRPGSVGTLKIDARGGLSTDTPLRIEAYDARGVMVDVEEFHLAAAATPPRVRAAGGTFTVNRGAKTFAIRSGSLAMEIAIRTGQILTLRHHGAPVIIGGPTLMLLEQGKGNDFTQILHSPPVLPLHGICSGWVAQKVEVGTHGSTVEVHVVGSYDQADGAYMIACDTSGSMHITYKFTAKKAMMIWQRGCVLDMPLTHCNLFWRRQALWSVYPPDHIARTMGRASAFSASPIGDAYGSRSHPQWPWSQDNMAGGSHDFRSTKRNILEASLGVNAKSGVRVRSDGRQHVRCWVAQQDRIRMLVADFIDDGAAIGFTPRVISPESLSPGSVVQGTVNLEIM